MKSPRRRTLRRWRPLALRGALAVGLLPKLLIPVGFMPAALSDGGPITVCSGYAALPAAISGPASTPMHGLHAAADHAGAYSEDDGKEHETHHQWERCAFAGTASSAPLGADWQLPPAAPAVQQVGAGTAPLAARLPRVFFRSRAPPILHS